MFVLAYILLLIFLIGCFVSWVTKDRSKEVQKGDEKENEIIPDDKEYELPKWKLLSSVMIVAVITGILICKDININTFIFCVLSLGFMWYLWAVGIFSHRLSKRRKWKMIIAGVVMLLFVTYMLLTRKAQRGIIVIQIIIVHAVTQFIYDIVCNFLERRGKNE